MHALMFSFFFFFFGQYLLVIMLPSSMFLLLAFSLKFCLSFYHNLLLLICANKKYKIL